MPRPFRILIGLLGGAAGGLLTAFLITYLWFDVLRLPAFNDDPKPALGMLAWSGLVLIPFGAIGGAVWLARSRGSTTAPLAVVALAMLAIVALTL